MSVLQSEPARANVAAETTEAAANAIETALGAVRGEHPAVDRWQLAAGLLAARTALVKHAGACSSEYGPLSHLVEARPRLGPAVERALNDHTILQREIDRLISRVNKNDVQAGHDRPARLLAGAIRAHQRRVTAIAFEWANRDIGGEG